MANSRQVSVTLSPEAQAITVDRLDREADQSTIVRRLSEQSGVSVEKVTQALAFANQVASDPLVRNKLGLTSTAESDEVQNS